MSNKIFKLLMVAIAASLIISGCVEKNTPVSDDTVGIPTKTAEKIPAKNEAMPATVVVAPTPQAEQKIPASEEPKLTIFSPEIISQGENFAVTLALKPHDNQKIVGIETNISAISADNIKITDMKIVSFSPEADKIIQERAISYANMNGITGDFAVIKFSAIQKGETEIIVKAMVVDENQFFAELTAKKIIKIV